MTASAFTTQALRDDIRWHLDQHHGTLITPRTAAELATHIAASLRLSYLFDGTIEPLTPPSPDTLSEIIRAGLMVHHDLPITAELAWERSANVTQALVGLMAIEEREDQWDSGGDTLPIVNACARAL